MKKLDGFIQSGIIYIGDPLYMSADKRAGEIVPDVTNPFKDWDAFTSAIGSEDAALPFPGAFDEGGSGRGVAVQTGRLNGKYELVKEYDENGRLSQIVIKLHD